MKTIEVLRVAFVAGTLGTGGAKMGSDEEIFKMVEGALKAGATGLSIGRNAFQHKDPTKMIKALSRMVHEGASVKEAIQTLHD